MSHANRFVARPGQELEFFKAFEKIRYEGRGVFVTADAVLQAFHDEFAAMLKAREADAQTDLSALTWRLMTHYAATAGDDPVKRYLATYFGVAALVLAAAEEIEEPEEDEFPYEGEEDEADKKKDLPSPMSQLTTLLKPSLKKLPAVIQKPVARHVRAMLAHTAPGQLVVPGYGSVIVDYTQFAVRGHYASSPLCGYFLAMNWLAQAPLPLHPETFALADRLASTPFGKKRTLMDVWTRIDTLVGAFMGRPVDATVSHLVELKKTQPSLLNPFDETKVAQALAKLRGPVPIRGLSTAIGRTKRSIDPG